MRIAALLSLAIALPLAGQDLGVHTSTIVRRGSNDLAHGLGVSLAGSFRLGDILVDSALARKASLRMGFRAVLSETRYAETSHDWCVDMCVPEAFERSVRSRMTKVTLFVVPLHSPTSRLDLGGGVAANNHTRSRPDGSSSHDGAWSFILSGAAAWRLRPSSPLWIHLEYTRHAEPPYYIADGFLETPGHSFNAGLVYRFADRRR